MTHIGWAAGNISGDWVPRTCFAVSAPGPVGCWRTRAHPLARYGWAMAQMGWPGTEKRPSTWPPRNQISLAAFFSSPFHQGNCCSEPRHGTPGPPAPAVAGFYLSATGPFWILGWSLLLASWPPGTGLFQPLVAGFENGSASLDFGNDLAARTFATQSV